MSPLLLRYDDMIQINVDDTIIVKKTFPSVGMISALAILTLGDINCKDSIDRIDSK